MMRAHLRMFLLHSLINAALLLLLYYWLGIGESTTSRLLLSFVLAALLLAAAAATYGSAFAYFRGQLTVSNAWRASVRHLVPLIACAAIIASLYWAIAAWSYVIVKPAFPVASWLTMRLQRPVRPAAVSRILEAILWIVRWLVLPVILVPLAAAVAEQGWKGFRAWRFTRAMQWLMIPVGLLIAIELPLKLIYWVPDVHGFALEAASFAARALTAYLLFCAAGLLVAFATSRGRPALTQASSAVSP